jgi:heterotetrameric sarcosine oxidase gamma subunit
MAEALSALAHLPAGTGGGGVTLREIAAGTILRIQTWPYTVGVVKRVATELLGVEAPPIGHAATNFETSLIAVAPGSFYVAGLAADIAWLVKEAVSPVDAAVTDLSHGRAVLALEGEAAGDVLQKCVAIDLSAFPPGRAAPTMIHHIDVLIHRRTETEFRLIVLRSFAEALAEWLLDAGLEEGIGFRR